MRTKSDINENKCEKCGKFVGNRNLEIASECLPEWEGCALCKNCYNFLKQKQEKKE